MFDRIVVVDWSANSAPKAGRDSVWIADDHAGRLFLHNPTTRKEAFGYLADVIAAGAGFRTLIGVDFSLGYPAGTAAALGLVGSPWRAMWTLLESSVVDDDRNRNNRFAVAARLNDTMGSPPGPFWGCPSSAAPDRRLTATRPARVEPDGLPATWRVVEIALRAAGQRPASSWQLLGAGSVGGQMLVGIPIVERLRRSTPQRIEIWPFTTGLRAPRDRTGLVTFAEVWPTLTASGAIDHPVRDARQVTASVIALRTASDEGRLRALLEPTVPDAVRSRIVDEEGWIVGVGGADEG